MENLELKIQTICFKRNNEDTWFNEEGSATVFFFRVACWQVLMTMEGVAKVEMSDKQFKSLIGDVFTYLNDEKLFLKSPVIPVVTDKILGCYRVRDGILYLGTNYEDEILQEFGSKYDLELDWL